MFFLPQGAGRQKNFFRKIKKAIKAFVNFELKNPNIKEFLKNIQPILRYYDFKMSKNPQIHGQLPMDFGILTKNQVVLK